MSRTDAHRPGWVQLFDPELPVYVRHDHRHGECIEETPEHARDYANHRFSSRHKYHCPRVRWEHYFCAEGEGKPCEIFTYPVWDYHDNVTWKARPCEGHRKLITDKSINCWHCENRLPDPTCFKQVDRGYLWQMRIYGGGVPKDFIQGEWSNPERRRVRDDLGAAKRLYNAGEDLDGYDFPNLQHRHGASWHYW